MKVAGIPAEYNPFHCGHEYMISRLRAYLGEETAIVCAMSGDFTQRGDCALFRKQARAAAAVMGGADLVLELPLPWSLASAEGFGRGAVSLLAATGIVTHLCFGSECGDLPALEEAAGILAQPEIDPLIREELRSGSSYAAARQRAFERLGGDGGLLSGPNNILALEYLKANKRSGYSLEAVTVARSGGRHDGKEDVELPSALRLRALAGAGQDIFPLLPGDAAAVLRRERDGGFGPVFASGLEDALLSRLRALPASAFASLPDAAEGIEKRLYRCVYEAASVAEALERAKTKRYALSRLRRMLFCAALGVREVDSAGTPPYIRVLAMSGRGRALVREMKKTAGAPLLQRPGQAGKLEGRARRVFELGSAAADFYALGFPDKSSRAAGSDFRLPPYLAE